MSEIGATILGLVPFLCFICLALGEPIRLLSRRSEWIQWARQTNCEFLGSNFPEGFPSENLLTKSYFVKCKNCVVRETNGIRYVVFDLRISAFWNRHERWQTVVASRVRSNDTARAELERWMNVTEESGWTILYPKPSALACKTFVLRVADLFGQKYIENDLVELLWKIMDENRVAAPHR